MRTYVYEIDGLRKTAWEKDAIIASQKQAIEHQKQIIHLEEIIAQTNKEKSEVAVIQPLVPLQQQLKSQTAYNTSLKAEINNLSQDLANFKREMKKELDDKANYYHGH
jgi:uncharacterized protein YlxW (UPF0749 family)